MMNTHQGAGSHLTYNRIVASSVPPGSAPPSRKSPLNTGILFEVGKTYKNRAGGPRMITSEFTEDWFEYSRGWRFVDDQGVCYKNDGKAHPKGEACYEDLVLQ